jgi:hypothetical protein
MRPLTAALVAAAVAAPASAAAVHPSTLYVRPHGPIVAFAQDRGLVAWFAPGTGRACNVVHVLSPSNGLHWVLPAHGRSAHNVTCSWPIPHAASLPSVQLALAVDGRSSSVLWTLREEAPPFDYLLGASLTDTHERRFQELAHGRAGQGLWLGGIAGDGDTLVYAVTSVEYLDEVGCLAGKHPACARRIGREGGLYRVVGRQPPHHVPGTRAAIAVAVSGRAAAYIAAARVGRDGRPVPAAARSIHLVAARSGKPLRTITPRGEPLALALTRHRILTLERTRRGLLLGSYARAGKRSWWVRVPSRTALRLTATDRVAVFHVGVKIRAVDLASHRVRTVAAAARPPIGLTLSGRRLAWAENVNGRGRIRILRLTVQ